MNNIKKGRTNVDFIRTEVTLGERDGEIVATCIAKLQLEKTGFDGLDYVWRKRFPHVSRNGVFTVTGKAICDDEAFDFEKGKNIAETRAQKKAYDVAAKIYNMISAEMFSAMKLFYELENNSKICSDTAAQHIVELDN